MQVWRADFSKSCYLQQVYQPRYLVESPRLFGPWYLEVRLRAYTHICCAHEHRRSSRVQHGLSSRPSSCPLRRTSSCVPWSNSPLARTLILPSPLILLHPLKALVPSRIAPIVFTYAGGLSLEEYTLPLMMQALSQSGSHAANHRDRGVILTGVPGRYRGGRRCLPH